MADKNMSPMEWSRLQNRDNQRRIAETGTGMLGDPGKAFGNTTAKPAQPVARTPAPYAPQVSGGLQNLNWARQASPSTGLNQVKAPTTPRLNQVYGPETESDAVQRILRENANVPFVQRIMNPNKVAPLKNPDGSISTHSMAWDGDPVKGPAYVYPTVEDYTGKGLQRYEGLEAVERARQANNVVKFDSPSQAQWFAEGGYKRAWDGRADDPRQQVAAPNAPPSWTFPNMREQYTRGFNRAVETTQRDGLASGLAQRVLGLGNTVNGFAQDMGNNLMTAIGQPVARFAETLATGQAPPPVDWARQGFGRPRVQGNQSTPLPTANLNGQDRVFATPEDAARAQANPQPNPPMTQGAGLAAVDVRAVPAGSTAMPKAPEQPPRTPGLPNYQPVGVSGPRDIADRVDSYLSALSQTGMTPEKMQQAQLYAQALGVDTTGQYDLQGKHIAGQYDLGKQSLYNEALTGVAALKGQGKAAKSPASEAFFKFAPVDEMSGATDGHRVGLYVTEQLASMGGRTPEAAGLEGARFMQGYNTNMAAVLGDNPAEKLAKLKADDPEKAAEIERTIFDKTAEQMGLAPAKKPADPGPQTNADAGLDFQGIAAKDLQEADAQMVAAARSGQDRRAPVRGLEMLPSDMEPTRQRRTNPLEMLYA